MSQHPPNILWISLEDTQPRFGCYGDPVARTPHLDKLAAGGCRWTHAFSTAGVCAPARSAIITGMYPTSIGTHHMRTTHVHDQVPELPTPYSAVVPHYVKCFTEYLRAAGIYCCNNVKTDYQFDPPRTAWDDLSPTAHWRNRPDKNQPFFAVFNPARTHESGAWPENCQEIRFDPADMDVPPYFPDTPKVREAMARLYTQLELEDQRVGELLGELERDGLSENTVVFHWSDHGPLPRGKRWPYDAGIHVPLLCRWPGILKPGSVTDRLVSTMDLGPTVLSIVGLPIPKHMQGKAFLGHQKASPREFIHAARDRHDEAYDMVRAVRDVRFKYIRHFHPERPYLSWIPYRNHHPILQEMWRLHLENQLKGPQKLFFQSPRPMEELYDLQEDPHEICNLAGESNYAPHLQRLRTEMDRWRKEVGDMGEIPEEEMVRRWYPSGKQPQTSTPLFIAVCRDNYGENLALEGGSFSFPCLLQIHCATQGTSVAYCLEEGEDVTWKLYTEPLRLPEGSTLVRARAIRIGYKESEERSATFVIKKDS